MSLAALAGAAALLVVLPSAARAGDYDNAWYSSYGVAEFTSQGWDGSGVRVAVVGDAIDTDFPEFDGAALTIDPDPLCSGDVTITSTDPSTLADTDAVAILVGNGTGSSAQRGIVPKAAVTFLGVGTDGATDCADPVAHALQRAAAAGAQVVLFERVFANASVADIEATAEALNSGMVIVTRYQNDPQADGSGTVPAVLNGVVSVVGFDGNDAPLVRDDGSSVIWPEATVGGLAIDYLTVSPAGAGTTYTSTRYGTALVAGIIAVARQRWSEATGSQLIQSLIHNTTGSNGQAIDDPASGLGYGTASLRGVMADGADPSQYPDVNPLLDKSSGQPPPQNVVPGGPTLSPTGSADPTASVSPTSDASSVSPAGSSLPVIIGGAIAVVVVLAVVVVVLVRRSRRAAGGGG